MNKPYIRSTDGAEMVAIAPGVFVNKRLLAALGLVELR